MATWTVAGVQTDAKLGDIPGNRAMILAKLAAAADAGANLVVFPECVLAGYGFGSRAEVAAAAEPVPGPTTAAVAAVCAARGVFCAFGLFEAAGSNVYNSCALVGPAGRVACYRKIHMPCVGADRFTDPGDGPLAVHDLGGLKVGIGICFDGSFPETARVLTLRGADLIILPTNWADKAMKNATLVARVRAFENGVYFMPVNRVGTEAGYHYIGHSSVVDPGGDFLASADHDREVMFTAEIDPGAARRKKVVHCVGEYEIDRVNWRRPDVYGPLVDVPGTPFSGGG